MGTIAEKLRHLAETKTAIKNAITAKGVSVAESDTFRSYATKIGEIQGSENDLEIPEAHDPFNIFFLVDFLENGDNINVMTYGYNSNWSFSIRYHGLETWNPPVPGSEPNVSTPISFYNYTGLKKQALVQITSNTANWTLYVTSNNPNVKITFKSSDYQLQCSSTLV